MSNPFETHVHVLSSEDTAAWRSEEGLPVADWNARQIVIDEAALCAQESGCSYFQIVDCDEKALYYGYAPGRLAKSQVTP